MSDLFISYASADRERAKLFADVLSEQGWSVWWDRAIPAGRQFDEVIEEALDAAKCVVVLWSQASVASTWVKTEAAEAMRRKALIPALIEDVKIPLEFRRLQAADLSRWQGDRTDPQLLHFFKSIEAEVSRAVPASGEAAAVTLEAPPPAASPRPPEPQTPAAPPRMDAAPPKRKLSPAVIAVIVAVIAALLAAGLYYERARSIEAAERAAREKLVQEQTERERTAREEAARLAAQRQADAQSQPKPRAAVERPAPAKAQGVPAAGVLNLQWKDHALGFSGSLTWSPSSAVLRAAVVDLQTGARIGNYAVPALISQQSPTEYVVSAEFAVPGDSATPGPHTHTSRLLVRAQPDGSLRFLQNCPQPGQCF